MGREARAFFERLHRRATATDDLGVPPELSTWSARSFKSFFFQKFSVELLRGQAELLKKGIEAHGRDSAGVVVASGAESESESESVASGNLVPGLRELGSELWVALGDA